MLGIGFTTCQSNKKHYSPALSRRDENTDLQTRELV